MKITQEQRKQAKSRGFLSNRDGEHFSARILTGNGVITARQLRSLSEAAEKYGNGQIALTSRMTLELPGVSLENMEALQEHIGKENMYTGGTGAKIRPVMACKGTVCVFGLIDTQSLAQEIHTRFFEGWQDVVLPHKFKIAVGGCPNNCVKPDLNDFGIIGQRVQRINGDLCRQCKKCAVIHACPMHAVTMNDGPAAISAQDCNCCGRCAGSCPFGALETQAEGYRIVLGGRWGKKTRIGTPLPGVFTRQEVLAMLEKAILLFKREGKAGERFGEMIDRLGFPMVEQTLFSDELTVQKAEILAAPVNA